LQHANGGTYAVTVSNAAGSTSSQAELIVRPVVAHATVADGILTLTIDATPGKTYLIQSGTNLVDWTDLEAIVPAAVRTEFQTLVGPDSQLYRLRVP
jgi:hypothetical protein